MYLLSSMCKGESVDVVVQIPLGSFKMDHFLFLQHVAGVEANIILQGEDCVTSFGPVH